jgi:uncharacterized phage protein gp47/JayE
VAYSENLETIKTRMLGNISDSVDKTEGYLVYDNVVATGTEFQKVSTELDQVVNKLDISNLKDDELATRIEERTGQTRNPATYATGVLTITGNATIAAGALFQTSNAVQFKSLETKTITTSGTINIQAVVAGSTGNIPAGQITVMPVAISGVTSVTNLAATENGFDAESDTNLLTRYYEKLQEPDTGGNIMHFKNLVKEYTGVGDVKVFPTWNGNNTIKLVIIDSNKQVPSTDFVNAVQAYMDPLGDTWGLGYGVAPFGAFTTIAGATAKTIDVSFTVVKDTNYTDAQRLANVQASINVYLKSVAFVDNAIVSYAQVGAAILASAGVLDYSNLLINSGTSNISISLTSSLCEIPVLGTVTINV